LPSLTDKGGLVRLAAIGAAVASVAGCFAYVAGWLSPRSLTQARLIDTFEQVNGIYSGFRRNHAKGVCIAGNFESNGQGTRLSKAVVFQPGRARYRPCSAGRRPTLYGRRPEGGAQYGA
jgi:catalase